MVDEQQAVSIITEALPGWNLRSFIELKDKYIFLMENPREEESGLDPFFSVDKVTGKASDFSILTDDSDNVLSEFEKKGIT